MRNIPRGQHLSDIVRMHFDRPTAVPLRSNGRPAVAGRWQCLRQRVLGRGGRFVRNSFCSQRLRRHTFSQSMRPFN